mmetsp:Transcript_18675/g.40242  ORF Transcript_18675/g.40242 Transcript_18675/m.40242 type:complete len:232 (-) Transcript_18675:902-1597(-)
MPEHTINGDAMCTQFNTLLEVETVFEKTACEIRNTEKFAGPPIRVGVNGFGRIGRQVVRILSMGRHPEMQLRHINSTSSPKYMQYLLLHDTVHGRFGGTCEYDDDALIINGMRISVSLTRNPAEIPWAASGVDYVCESTGGFLSTEDCAGHFEAGAKKVVISAPAKDDTPTIVVGVNDQDYDYETMHVVSCASCTTNGLAPLVKLIHEKWGIKHGMMTTVSRFNHKCNGSS